MHALKAVNLCLCLSVAAVIGKSKLSSSRFLTSRDREDCIKDVQSNTDELEKIQRWENPTTMRQKCLVTCIWKKAKVMSLVGFFLPENAALYLKDKLNIPENEMEYVRNVVYRCLSAVSSTANECVVGGHMYSCITDARRAYRPDDGQSFRKKFPLANITDNSEIDKHIIDDIPSR